jgi:hypothetical protein
MAGKSPIPLPVATLEYSSTNESLTRRQLEQIIQNLQTEVTLLKNMTESGTSKSVRRHQFLLMGS